MTHRQPRYDSKAGKKRLKGRPEKLQSQARKYSKAAWIRLKGRQEMTQRQQRQDSLKGREDMA